MQILLLGDLRSLKFRPDRSKQAQRDVFEEDPTQRSGASLSGSNWTTGRVDKSSALPADQIGSKPCHGVFMVVMSKYMYFVG
jgi:hypothetical protein